MFKKILIANRGEIAVRIIRTCREMGIANVALYEASDRGSLHVRLADECLLLRSPGGFLDQEAILRIAKESGADAIHPGYGFLAEREDFIQACGAAGVAFVGPPAEVVETARQKLEVLDQAQQAGFLTPEHSSRFFDVHELKELRAEAEKIGYPLVVKSCRGGRGRGERLVWSAERLGQAVRRSQAEAQVIYGDRRVYLEKAVLPAHQIAVQVLGDQSGHLIHLGEREGSLLAGNQKIVEETPAPCLDSEQRARLCQDALELARLFNYQNLGTIEFLVDSEGHFYFTEIKPRIQMDHPLTEMVAGIDLVREQIRLAAGEALDHHQEDIYLRGWAMQCRISAEDPWQHFMPSPGRLRQVRLPGGPGIRVDTYLYSGCEIPGEYDPLIAKLVVWGQDRPTCLQRMRRALQEFQLTGTPTNLPLLKRILEQPDFSLGRYNTEILLGLYGDEMMDNTYYRDLAVAAAIVYTRRTQSFFPSVPERLLSGWHRESHRLP